MNDTVNALDNAGTMAGDLARNAAQNAAVQDAYDRFEKGLAAVKTEVAELSQRVSDAVSAFGVIAQEEAGRRLKGARENIDALTTDASGRAGAAAGAVTVVAKDTASSIGDTLADAIERRPVATLALAVTIGILIGVVWRR